MKKILIVDDQEGWQNFNKQAMYETFGENIKIQTASSAQEGYNILLENLSEPFDIIITDMQMEDDFAPKMAGEWLIEQAKSLSFCCRTKIVIISASPQIKNVAETYGVDYIPKSTAVASQEAIKSVFC